MSNFHCSKCFKPQTCHKFINHILIYPNVGHESYSDKFMENFCTPLHSLQRCDLFSIFISMGSTWSFHRISKKGISLYIYIYSSHNVLQCFLFFSCSCVKSLLPLPLVLGAQNYVCLTSRILTLGVFIFSFTGIMQVP